MRHSDGNARPGSWYDMDARSILGVPPVRPSLLVYLPPAEPRKAEAGRGACLVTGRDDAPRVLMNGFRAEEGPDDDFDDEDDLDEEDEEQDDDEDEDKAGDEEDTETWQVSRAG
jgi:hypothetical protein